MKQRFGRRAFIVGSAQVGASLGCAALLDGCSGGVSTGAEGSAATAPHARQQSAQLTLFAFTTPQRDALSAAVARLIPAQGAGDWSAADAGAVEYIEQLLNAFSTMEDSRVYGGGPSRDRFGKFQKLSRVKIAGWQAEILRLREVYTQGLDELNRLARGPLSLLPGRFSEAPAPLQDRILELLDYQGSPFFAALYAHTMEGVYGHPVYGGNRDYVAWNSLDYAGDVHGVRFPGGHDPEASAQPWRKFGGYSPDEMAKPGVALDKTRAAPSMSDGDLLQSLQMRITDYRRLT